MEKMCELLNRICCSAENETKLKLNAQDALMKDLFSFLLQKSLFEYDRLLLCTQQGLVICDYSHDSEVDLSGKIIAAKEFEELKNGTSVYTVDEQYLIVSGASFKEANPSLEKLCGDLRILRDIFSDKINEVNYIYKCLDVMEHPLCIVDKETVLVYANKSYCNLMNISQRSDAIGRKTHDIFAESNVVLNPARAEIGTQKMLDVLKTGRKERDWEIKIETQSEPDYSPSILDTIYPIKNDDNEVEGVIELIQFNRLPINKVTKTFNPSAEHTFETISGNSPIIKERKLQAKEYAKSEYSILIIGESGTGKELFAQAIHNYSNRANEAFIAINCANFQETLIDSELFGYVGGAFTGASKSGQIGKFELANKGTLFLDEIGELPYHFQSKLLRVLETGSFMKIGGTKETKVDVRVIAATNRNLESMVKDGLFRQDLYYRLQVLNIEIPPLRERQDDVISLAETFLKQIALSNGEIPKILDISAKRALTEYEWLGNVRELKNVIQRIAILCKDNSINAEDVEHAIYSDNYRFTSKNNEDSEDKLKKCFQKIDSAYAQLISEALKITEGNKSKAADLIGISRTSLYRMMEKYF